VLTALYHLSGPRSDCYAGRVATDHEPIAIDLPASAPEPELPVAGQAPRRRADAQRNHERVLRTARRLFAERGVENVSMDAIATGAGVGKGTIFRAFGDRSNLVGAILGEDETVLQDRIIRGPAPLGPGAPPLARIVAFGHAYMDFLEDHLDLLIASEVGPGVRFGKGPFQLYRTHLTMLVREALGGSGVDADYTGDVLLAPLAAEFFAYQRRGRGRSLDELASAYACLADRLLSGR
jgi:AcrR family transcriptional regulator